MSVQDRTASALGVDDQEDTGIDAGGLLPS